MEWSKIMDENRAAGTAEDIGGKAQEGIGRIVGDPKIEAEGVVNQVKGAAQDLYGRAREGASQIADAASETAAAAQKSASSFESSLRNMIETQPYTAASIALGLGWLLGRMHRPL
jgi:uncharacterized protein YjbJ (UPF0337 family)